MKDNGKLCKVLEKRFSLPAKIASSRPLKQKYACVVKFFTVKKFFLLGLSEARCCCLSVSLVKLILFRLIHIYALREFAIREYTFSLSP